MKVFLLALVALGGGPAYARGFNERAANMAKGRLAQELPQALEKHFTEEFEYKLQHLQNLLKLGLQFSEGVESYLNSQKMARRQDPQKLIKGYKKLEKDFTQSLKRREKFFEKDLLRPRSREFQKRVKAILKEFRASLRRGV